MQQEQPYSVRPALRSLVHTILNLAFADGLSLVAIAVFIIMLGRLYGSASLGKFSFALALASMAQTLCIAGYDISMPRRISREPENAARHSLSALRVQMFLAIWVLPLCIFGSLMKDPETVLCTVILCLDVLPTALAFGFVSALRGLHFASEAARINAIGNVTPMIFCASLLWFGAPIWVFALCILCGDLLKLRLMHRLFLRRSAQQLSLSQIFVPSGIFDKANLLSAWKEQRSMSLTSLFSVVVVRMPSVMLGWFATDVQNGLYSAAARFFTALRIVPGAFLHTIIPRYTQSSESLPRIRSILVLSAGCALLMSGILYFGAPAIMYISFRFADSVAILQILAIAFFALFMKTTLEAFLLAAHRENFINVTLITIGLMATLGYWYAATHSALAIAWVLSAAESCLAIVFLAAFIAMRLKRSHSTAHEVRP